MKKILKYHNYKIIAKEGTKPSSIHIPVINNLPYKEIQTSCGCTSVTTTSTEYIVSFDLLPQVKWMVGDNKIQHYFIESVDFTIVHEDDSTEKVTINIAVYDSL